LGEEYTNMKPILKNKKAMGFEQTIFIIAIIFAFAIFFLILLFTWNKIEDPLINALTSSTPAEENSNVTSILEQVGNTTARFNVWFPFLLVGLFGYVFMSAMFIKSHPMFFFVGLIVLGVALVLAGIYANVYHQISSSPEFATELVEFSIMEMVMEWLPFIVFLVFILIGVILYVNKGSAGSTSGL